MFYAGEHYNGGPYVNGLRMTRQLNLLGHCILPMVLSYNGDDSAHRYFTSIGIDSVSFNIPARREDVMRWILEELQRFNPDVFIPNICLSGLYASRWVQKAGIVTVAVQRSIDRRNSLIAEIFGFGKFWKTTGFVCVSKYLLDITSKFESYSKNVSVIPSGVVLHNKCANQTKNNIKICYAGRLEKGEKRVDLISSAFFRLARNKKLSFTFIGEGREKQNLVNSVQSRKLDKRITFTRFLIDKEYYSKLMEHNIIVLFSDFEGMPGAIMDGMSCGLIPVCRHYDGLEELVLHKETGFVFRTNEEFEQIINQLVSDQKLRIKISYNARRHIEKYYSLTVCAKKWELFLKELLKTNMEKKDIIIPKRFRGKYHPELIGFEIPHETTFNKYLKKAIRIIKRIFT